MKVTRILQNISLLQRNKSLSGDAHTRKLFKCVNKCFKSLISDGKDYYSMEDLENVINHKIKPKYKIQPVSLSPEARKKLVGEQDFVFDENNNLKHLTIGLLFKRGRFKKESLPVFIHELTHALIAIEFPKTVRRMAIAESVITNIDKSKNLPVLGKQYNRFYSNSLNNEETVKPENIDKLLETLKTKLKRLLAGLSAEQKINIIQMLRYDLQGEYYANMIEKQAADIMRKKEIKLNEYYDDFDYSKFFFIEKLNLLKETFLEIANTERIRHSRAILKKHQ